jgi:hypothetical protein
VADLHEVLVLEQVGPLGRPIQHTVWLREPKMVEKIAHRRGFTVVVLEL